MLEVDFYFVVACKNIKSNVRIHGCKRPTVRMRQVPAQWGGKQQKIVAHLNFFFPQKNLFSSPISEMVSSNEHSVIQMMNHFSLQR